MKIQQLLNTPTLILSVIASLSVGLGLPIMAYSPWGRELYLDIWLNVLTPFCLLGLYGYLLARHWSRWGLSQKRGMVIMAVLVVGLACASLYFYWPGLPWGRASAFQTANDFMAHLKAAQYSAAVAKLTPTTQKHISAEDLNNAVARPITWQLTTLDRASNITGTATFADGIELPITIRLHWLDGQWRIYGVTFGEWFQDANGTFQNTTRMDFMACCDSYGPVFDAIWNLIKNLL